MKMHKPKLNTLSPKNGLARKPEADRGGNYEGYIPPKKYQ